MSDIKEVIALLCQQLNYLFEVEMKPEHFRLAKFNQSAHNVVYYFWSLLYKFTKRSTVDMVNAVKLFLHSMNYKCLSFYSIPNDMSCGSRELLLALGFVMTKNNILYDMIQNKVGITPFNPKYSILPVPMGKRMRYNSEVYENKDKKTNQWIKGRTAITEKLCSETKDKINQLLKQASSTAEIRGTERPSMNEILAMKKKEYGKIFLAETEDVMRLLVNHVKWTKKENIFWEWMNTVTIERQKDTEKIDYKILKSFLEIVTDHA